VVDDQDVAGGELEHHVAGRVAGELLRLRHAGEAEGGEVEAVDVVREIGDPGPAVAGCEHEVVARRTAGQDVVAGAAVEGVAAAAADEPVVAGVAGEAVVAAAAGKPVAAGAADQDVAAGTAVQRVVAAEGIDRVGTRGAGQQVVAVGGAAPGAEEPGVDHAWRAFDGGMAGIDPDDRKAAVAQHRDRRPVLVVGGGLVDQRLAAQLLAVGTEQLQAHGRSAGIAAGCTSVAPATTKPPSANPATAGSPWLPRRARPEAEVSSRSGSRSRSRRESQGRAR